MSPRSSGPNDRDDPQSGDIQHSSDDGTTMPFAGKVPLPERVGAHRILELSGMGIVCLAEQERPIRRRAALKLIRVGMDTKEVVSRFEAERQALALMDHPNIAKVFEAGATADKMARSGSALSEGG